MRLCRFDKNRVGLVRGDNVHDVTAVVDALPRHAYPLPRHDVLIEGLGSLRGRLEAAADKADPLRLDSVALLSPVANPGKIVAAPVNYAKHLAEARTDPEIHHQNQINEIQRTGLFLKATSSLIGASQPIVIRHPDRRNDHEVELVAVIGREANRVTRDTALDHVAGFCVGLDMTTRGPEERSFRKSIDSYSVLGPWMVTADEFDPTQPAGLELRVNGEVRQNANTRDLVIGLADLIAFASSFYTLFPGDLLFSGTPEGVGPVQPGDRITASIERIGTLDVAVQA